MKMKVPVLFPIIAVLLLTFAACSQFQAMFDKDKMTPERYALFLNETYVTEYDNYLTHFVLNGDNYVVAPWVTESQKKALRKKKQILVEAKPLLDIYTTYARDGTVPEGVVITTLEKQLTNLLNRLVEVED